MRPLSFVLATRMIVRAIPTNSAFHPAHYLSTLVPAGDEPEEEVGSTVFWWKIGISVALVLLGGAFAGLTIGLMGLDQMYLRVLATAADDPIEKRNAQRVLRLIRKGRHWVLVVLLLGNVIVNESLPIFLDSAIGGGVAAIVISTVLIVIFGEVIPQAVCARYGLSIGAKSAPLVLTLMYVFAPIAWPIAKLLDKVLGEDSETTYKKAELKSFLQFHRGGQSAYGTYTRADATNSESSQALPLSDDEITILNAVLSLNEKTVAEIMTPIDDVVTLGADQVVDHDFLDHILSSGYSRFPVHEPGKPFSFIGFLLVKRLLLYDPDERKRVGDFQLTVLPEARPTINCFQALDYFQTGRAHLLLISETPGKPYGALGVVTLEDIIEEIISEEIVDETDVYEDNRSQKRAKRQSTAAVMRGIVEHEARKRRGSRGSIPGTPKVITTTIISAPPIGRLKAPAETAREALEEDGLLHTIHEYSPNGDDSSILIPNGRHERSDYGATWTESPPKQSDIRNN